MYLQGPQKNMRQLRLLYCPELRNGIGDWGFKEEEGNWWENG